MTDKAIVRLEREGAVATLVLARPEAGNAVSLALCQAFHDAVETCAADASVRAVLIRAEGAAFCVGGDLAEFQGRGDERPAHLMKLAPVFHAAQARLMTMPAPVVVAVQGAAAGAGLGLALCGDIVLAAASARFTLAYTAIGLSPDGGSTHLLPRLIGLRRTQDLMLTNRRLTAAEALDMGLVTEVLADRHLETRAREVALRLAAGPTQAYGEVKRLLSLTFERGFAAQTDDEGDAIARLSGGDDAAEGIDAFFAKRPPVFAGKP
ncbi:MAG TPA: enoyl-CoA hydratase-related protein [Caulobacter sp.]|nr:enoyl-CoA hydratase-related protein [Caulobacter sp.]